MEERLLFLQERLVKGDGLEEGMHDIYVLIWFISFRNGHIAPEAVQLPQDAYLHFHQLMVQAIAVQIVEALLQIAFYVLAGVAVLQVGYHHFSGE